MAHYALQWVAFENTPKNPRNLFERTKRFFDQLSECRLLNKYSNTRYNFINILTIMGCKGNLFLYHGSTALVGKASSLLRFREHTQLHTPKSAGLLRTSDRPFAVSSTVQDTQHSQETNMSPAEFEPAIPASQWSRTRGLGRAATGIRKGNLHQAQNKLCYLPLKWCP